MELKKLLRTICDLLSWFGFAFLLGDGIDKSFPYSGVTVIHQHRWEGFLMLVSAIALAIRLGTVRNGSDAAKDNAA